MSACKYLNIAMDVLKHEPTNSHPFPIQNPRPSQLRLHLQKTF
jgi:hypothetical protein